jgi:tetratricopeptide (TPR) repeat protein
MLSRPPARILVFLIAITLCLPAAAADQHWLRVSSDHFVVLTDAGQKPGHDLAARFEQMRAIFGELLMRSKIRMGEPLQIIAIGNDREYQQLAPVASEHSLPAPGFWIPGEDRIFIVLNLSEPESWRAIEHRFAHYWLNYNYPPTPAWFDEGFAEYFASLHFTKQNAEFGADPEPNSGYGSGPGSSGNLKSLTEILENPVWLAWPDLLTMKNRVVNGREGTHHTLFYAQSWILVHFLINRDKMSEAGKYFGLVELQKMPVEPAIQQAFAMNTEQLDHEVKKYFHSLSLTTALDAAQPTGMSDTAEGTQQTALPFSLEEVSTSSEDVRSPDAQALIDEMELRIPERRQRAFADLQRLIDNPQTETVVAHRALAWAYVQNGDTPRAFEELSAAMHKDANDRWTRLGVALASYHSGQQGARIQGLANMMESLRMVIDVYPEFAEAHNMLGWAQLQGGGPNAAIQSFKTAVELAPREQGYQLRLAEAYFSAKKFAEASEILNRLKQSDDPEIVRAAAKDLKDLPFLEKYGVPPEDTSAPKQAANAAPNPSTTPAKAESADDDDDEPSPPKPAITQPSIDKRPVKFLKVRLLSVDCSKAPAAVLSVSAGGKKMTLNVADYKSVAVIGADNFSCAWKDLSVNINYRASGNLSGDLVSIEIQ